MNTQRANRRWIFLFAALMLATPFVVSAIVSSARKQQPKISESKGRLTSIPRVMSKVRDLEIVNARIVRADTEAPGVGFEIRNNSDRAVMAVDIMCGGAGMSKDGLADEEHPTVVIEPYGTLAVEMNDEVTPGLPIVLSGAAFADGKEEGTETSLKAIHRGRKHERERLKAEREGKPAEGELIR
jgi:hypothetical protein